jgi:uncharacterized membrane protein
MKLFHKIANGSILSLNTLLLFFLFFQDRISFPVWIQSIGRMHPLMLHLPIGAIVVAAILIIFRREFKEGSFESMITLILSVAAVSASCAALMGFVLSKEGGYNQSLLGYHLIAGIALSLSSWLLLALVYQKRKIFNSALVFTLFILIITGHLGATLTHGENFVLAPLMKSRDEIVPITDSTTLYHAAIEPVFKAKCMSCHNKQKIKGDLLMTSAESILKGGKHGAIWKAGDPLNSKFIQRINLPNENEEHMPPQGKPPLTDTEKQLLFRWVLAGADVTTAWTKFESKDTLMMLAKQFIHIGHEERKPSYEFPFASKEIVKQLNSPYRVVTQLAADSPALAAEFFVSQSFESTRLKELLPVKEQLVSLTLAGMPVKDTDGKLIGEFTNLEKLNLNKTEITDGIATSLIGFKKLKTLSLVGTSIGEASLKELTKLPELKEVFLWNTKVDKAQLTSLQKQFPVIQWNFGYPPTEVLRLTSPLLVNDSLLIKRDQRIQLKHNLAGTIIRYTLDGTIPDSLTGTIYKEPISIDGFTTLKAIACRSEWWTSAVAEFTFFKSGYMPTSGELLTQADKSYRGEGVKTLMDNKKSTAADFRDNAWLGFKEHPLEALFYFDKEPTLKSVTVSYCKNYYSFLVQPELVELWAGDEKNRLRLIKKIVPSAPMQNKPSFGVDAIIFQLPAEQYHYYKIIAKPNSKLPEFISKKRDKAWLFVDEVIFN